jgi:hypothetical protein
VDEEKLRKILERADWSFPGEGEITAFNRRCFIKLPSTQLNGEMMEALIYFLVEVAQRIEENVLLEADTKTSQVQNSSQPVIASPLPNSPPALPSGWTAFALRHDLVTHPAERALSGEWGEWEVALRAMQFGHGAYLNPALQQGTQVQIVLIEGLEACLNLTIRRLDSELEFSTVLESDTVLEGIVEGFMPLAVLLEERMENDLFPAVAAIHENVLTLTLPGLISSSAALRQLLDAATGLADRIELAVIEKMESITLETLHR